MAINIKVELETLDKEVLVQTIMDVAEEIEEFLGVEE